MQEIDKPTLAAINGDAIGAGLDMALQCDLRYASDRARFAEGYVNLGLVPGDGGHIICPASSVWISLWNCCGPGECWMPSKHTNTVW